MFKSTKTTNKDINNFPIETTIASDDTTICIQLNNKYKLLADTKLNRNSSIVIYGHQLEWYIDCALWNYPLKELKGTYVSLM